MAAQTVKQTDTARPVMVFFEDEAKFGRMNHVRKCSVHRPDRAIVKKQAIREYLYAFTTVCPQTGETCSIISPLCNTEAMNALLHETSLTFPNYRIIMIMDAAGWHTTKKLVLPENITILPFCLHAHQNLIQQNIFGITLESKKTSTTILLVRLTKWITN